MKVNKNKMTDEQRKVYDFIEANVSSTHRLEATLLMGHLSFIHNTCKKYLKNSCFGCPLYNEKDKHYEACLMRSNYPVQWNIEMMIKNIFSNLD